MSEPIAIRLTWEEWKAELDRLGGDDYGPEGAVKGWGEEWCRELYDDGVTPEDAIEDDKSYWED
jgi:hypothetical protein